MKESHLKPQTVVGSGKKLDFRYSSHGKSMVYQQTKVFKEQDEKKIHGK